MNINYQIKYLDDLAEKNPCDLAWDMREAIRAGRDALREKAGHKNLFGDLLKEIQMAKTGPLPQCPMHTAHGKICMAFNLGAITREEFLDLERWCVAEGINNPQYFDRD